MPGQREIDAHFLTSHEEVYNLARKNKWNKLLYFCNKRETVETTSAALSQLWHPYPVIAHHGSLERRVREEAEEVIKQSSVAICVATSTLEVGIDIGDIDLIVLAEIPWSVSSLIQRIGRGNRREKRIRVVAISNSAEEKGILEAMFEVAKNGSLLVGDYEPDLSVAIQQTFSYLYQHPGGVSEQELMELLAQLCGDDRINKKILNHLSHLGWIEWRESRWFASTKLMDRGERGYIHSNIPDSQAYRVVDVDSGKEIGNIAGFFDEIFILGRRTWRVVSVVNDVICVRRFSGKAAAPLFRRYRNSGAFSYLLPPELKVTNKSFTQDEYDKSEKSS